MIFVLPLVIALILPVSERSIKLPVKIETPGVLYGFWDVGACYVSGQPSEEAFRKLASDGVKTVINLRGTTEMNDRAVVPFDEAALLRELEVKYIHIPVGETSEYNPTAIARFADALGKAEGKVLLHCTVAWRASYAWAAYLHTYRGYTLDEATKHGSSMHFSGNRIASLLSVEMTYESKTSARDSRAPKGDFAPKAVFAPSDDYMAFTMWQMGDVFNASQPKEEHLRDLAAKGVKTVINIRGANEMTGLPFDEKALVESLGMKYVHVPMQSAESFSPENLKLIADAIAGTKGKVLLHCQTATRTSSIWAAYLVKYRKLTLDEALKHGEAMRFGNILKDFLGKDIIYKVKLKAPAGGCSG